MRPDIKFHCDINDNFKNEFELIRAFTYTDYSIEPHNHNFYEMNIVLNGTGTHQIENACFKVKAGDVFVIPPLTVHAYFNTSKLDVYHILLQKKFISENIEEAMNVNGFLQLTEIEPFLRSNYPEEMFLSLSPNQLLQLKSELKFIEDNGDFSGKEYIPLKNHTTWKIIYWLSGLLSNQINSDKKAVNKYEHSIINTLEYIHQSYGEKITVELLCKKAFMSRSTFLRYFNAVCGCTPNKYLNNYRSKKALEMIENTDYKKTEIAHLCGFYDLSHMERILKSYK